MNLGIIAAGEGSRLRQEGINLPKPLVKINEESLISRQLRLGIEAGMDKLYIIINEQSTEVRDHVLKSFPDKNFHFIIKSTPSSFHSFYELSKACEQNQPILISTVDPVIPENDYKNYIKAAHQTELDACMAVTGYVDDEKPLFIKTDKQQMIRSFQGTQADYNCISGGIYCFYPEVFRLAETAMQRNISRMRNFQQFLIEQGLKIKAHFIDKIIDVDHISDIEKAKSFLKGE